MGIDAYFCDCSFNLGIMLTITIAIKKLSANRNSIGFFAKSIVKCLIYPTSCKCEKLSNYLSGIFKNRVKSLKYLNSCQPNWHQLYLDGRYWHQLLYVITIISKLKRTAYRLFDLHQLKHINKVISSCSEYSATDEITINKFTQTIRISITGLMR